MSNRTIQLWVSVALIAAGIILLFMGFWVTPAGVIHNSVLIAFGEICTFAGALFGIDYRYRFNNNNNNNNNNG